MSASARPKSLIVLVRMNVLPAFCSRSGMSTSGVIRFTSIGTPGTTTMTFPSRFRAYPQAVPTGLRRGAAPCGNTACLALLSVHRSPREAKRSLMACSTVSSV
ncbi:MAG: hypothetical protein A4E67_00086 [Syntrophaceae bacterium PtaB.Bin038]|nr:MAG: hypothetical protein A4E67_00086 [Syntrophaceae bacterium PtaB.Bin038]